MSRKHKKNQDFFNRRNNEGIKNEKAALDLSKLRIRAGMAAVSALLILSPVVISAAGSIANPTAQDIQGDTGISDPEQTGSPYWLSAGVSCTGSTAADAGSTLAADPQGTFHAYIDKEGADTNETFTRMLDTKDNAVPEPDKARQEKDEETPETDKGSREENEEGSETGETSKEEKSEEEGDEEDDNAPQSMTNEEAAEEAQAASTNAGRDLDETVTDKNGAGRDLNETATDKNDPDKNSTDRDQNEHAADQGDLDDADTADAGKADPDEDAGSTGAVDDESEDDEDDDVKAARTGATDSESAEDPGKQENEDENSTGFSSYGSNDFPGAITPDVIRIPADEWAAYGESADGFLDREKDFFAEGTPIFFDLKGAEYSAAIRNNCFDLEKIGDETAVVIDAAALKDGTGVYENVVEYIIRNAGSTSSGKKVDLVLTLDETRIELPEDIREKASGKIVVSAVYDNHIFRAEARSIPVNTKDDDTDRKNEAETVDVKASEKWSARIIWHEGNDVAEPRAFLFIPDLGEVFGDPGSETCDRERVAMLSGFSGKAFCCEDAAVSVSSSGYLEGNGLQDAVILPVNSANIQFAWGGTNCSTDIITDFSRIKSEEPSEKDTSDKDDPTDSDNTTDANTDTDSDSDIKTETNTEKAALADTEESIAESPASGAAILISYEEEPEKLAGLSAGNTVEISMNVKNIGSELLKDVEVSEMLDDDAKIAVAWDRSSDPVTGENTLSEGETVPLTVNYTVTQDDIDAGKLVRRTEASAETTDRDAVEDEQTSEVILKGTASIDFSKKAAVQQISDAREGMSIRYYFTVTNSGNVTLRNIEVIDQMAGLSRIEYEWAESTDGRTGEGYLSPGEKVTASAAYTITSADIRNGKIINKAFARGETLQGEVIESSQPEAPTSISQEGNDKKLSGSPATGDDTDIFIYLMPAIISFTVLITSLVLGEIQRRKMDFDNEDKRH